MCQRCAPVLECHASPGCSGPRSRNHVTGVFDGPWSRGTSPQSWRSSCPNWYTLPNVPFLVQGHALAVRRSRRAHDRVCPSRRRARRLSTREHAALGLLGGTDAVAQPWHARARAAENDHGAGDSASPGRKRRTGGSQLTRPRRRSRIRYRRCWGWRWQTRSRAGPGTLRSRGRRRAGRPW